MSKIPENPTVVSLVKQAKDEYERRQKETLKKEEQNRQEIIRLTELEKSLKLKIEAGKKQIAKMEDEFEELEKERMKLNLAEIQKSEVTKKDVQEGKASIHQFYMQGKEEDEIKRMMEGRTLEDLEKVSDMIRAKGTEIARLELELYSTQCTIFGLVVNPVKYLRASYRELGEMLDYQLGPLTEDWHSAKSNKVQKEHELMLIEKGFGLSGGYRWDNITVKEARRLIHNPVIPKEHISSLLEQLDEVEKGSLVSISYHHKGTHWPGLPIEVHESFESDEVIKSDRMSK